MENNSNNNSSDKVQSKSSYYIDYMERIDIIISLLGGTMGMRDAGEKYLPRNYGEETGDYQVRLERTFLLNVFKRTAEKLTGEVFSEKIVFEPSGHKESDDIIVEFLKNVDDNKTNINQFSEKIFYNGITKGVSHILVDFPEIKTRKTEKDIIQYLDENNIWKNLSQKVVKKNNWRPFWNEIKSEKNIGWRTEKKNGKNILIQVRIEEVVEELIGEFGTKNINRIKVLEIGGYSIYIQSSKDKNIYIKDESKSGKTVLIYIPLYSFMPGEQLSTMTASSPLEDLAYLNVEHWQSSSSQRNVLHHAREITFFGKMLAVRQNDDGETEIIVGHNRMITSEDPEGSLEIVEPSGAAIEAGRNDLKDTKEEMSMWGLTYMMPKTGNTTATEKAIDTSENDSVLLSQTRLFEDILNQCLKCTYEYLMIDDPKKQGKLIINKEFKNKLSHFGNEDLIKAGIANILPKETIIQELLNRKAINTEDDAKEIMSLLNNELTLNNSTSAFSGSIKVKKEEEKNIEE